MSVEDFSDSIRESTRDPKIKSLSDKKMVERYLQPIKACLARKRSGIYLYRAEVI